MTEITWNSMVARTYEQEQFREQNERWFAANAGSIWGLYRLHEFR